VDDHVVQYNTPRHRDSQGNSSTRTKDLRFAVSSDSASGIKGSNQSTRRPNAVTEDTPQHSKGARQLSDDGFLSSPEFSRPRNSIEGVHTFGNFDRLTAPKLAPVKPGPGKAAVCPLPPSFPPPPRCILIVVNA